MFVIKSIDSSLSGINWYTVNYTPFLGCNIVLSEEVWMNCNCINVYKELYFLIYYYINKDREELVKQISLLFKMNLLFIIEDSFRCRIFKEEEYESFIKDIDITSPIFKKNNNFTVYTSYGRIFTSGDVDSFSKELEILKSLDKFRKSF